MIAAIVVLALLAVGGVLLFELEARGERRVDLASEFQVPGSAQIRAAYDRAFRTRTWSMSVAAGMRSDDRRQRAVDSDVRAA